MSFGVNSTPLNFSSAKGKQVVAVESTSLRSHRILLKRILTSRMTSARLCGTVCEKAGFQFSSPRTRLGADEEFESAWDPSTVRAAVTSVVTLEVSPVSVVFDWSATTKVGVRKCGGVYAAYVLKTCIITSLSISASTWFGSHRDGRGISAFRPDKKTFCALLEGTKRIGDLGRARWILAEMVRSGKRVGIPASAWPTETPHSHNSSYPTSRRPE